MSVVSFLIPFDEKELYLNLLDRLPPSHVDILLLIEREKQPTTTVEYAQHLHEYMRGWKDPTALSIETLPFLVFLGDLQQAGLIVAVSCDPFYARLRARQFSGNPGVIAVMRKLLVRCDALWKNDGVCDPHYHPAHLAEKEVASTT